MVGASPRSARPGSLPPLHPVDGLLVRARPRRCGRRFVDTIRPFAPREGVDALSDIAEDVESYAVNERCDVVPRELCFAEWMSLPQGKVGSFNAMRALKGKRRKTYANIRPLLVPEGLAAEAACQTGAFVGMCRTEYCKLVRRMLDIGMVVLRKEVKVVNGIFGVWKIRPEGGPGESQRLGGKHTGARAQAQSGPQGPSSGSSPPASGYKSPGKIRDSLVHSDTASIDLGRFRNVDRPLVVNSSVEHYSGGCLLYTSDAADE